jgi:hypothetical protein
MAKTTVENPGIYDDECTQVRKETQARGVVLLVVGGNKGGGFSVQVEPAILPVLPEILEEAAKQIRADLEEIRKAEKEGF